MGKENTFGGSKAAITLWKILQQIQPVHETRRISSLVMRLLNAFNDGANIIAEQLRNDATETWFERSPVQNKIMAIGSHRRTLNHMLDLWRDSYMVGISLQIHGHPEVVSYVQNIITARYRIIMRRDAKLRNELAKGATKSNP